MLRKFTGYGQRSVSEGEKSVKRAIVTGATGVLGSALVKELNRCGIEVLALVREGSSHNERIPDIEGNDPENLPAGWNGKSRIKKAVCPLDRMSSFEVPEGSEPYDVFYHLGWAGTKGRERSDPRIHTKNIGYALDAADLAARYGCGCFIGAGSQAEYGRTEERLKPYTPVFPENAYGIAKLCAGQMTREYAHGLGMRHIWTRILSVYGPNDGGKTLITYMIGELLLGHVPETTKGEQVWDYLYADDAAKCLRMLGEHAENCDGKTYLIASGKERTLRSYIEELRDIVSPGAEIGFGKIPYGKRQVMHLSADISLTEKDTGWKPETSFAEGIRRMLDEQKVSG